jgi:uncharacterized protein
MDTDISVIKPAFQPTGNPDSPAITQTIEALKMERHIEGGYFSVTDRDPYTISPPYPTEPASQKTLDIAPKRKGYNPALRNLSSSIHYLLTPELPIGHFHSNRCRIVHSVHRGRGRYVIVHQDGRVESFIVGLNVAAGERLQWVVEGGPWKASFLLPDEEGGSESQGLLITETAVPGFEYCDNEHMAPGELSGLVDGDTASKLEFLVRQD